MLTNTTATTIAIRNKISSQNKMEKEEETENELSAHQQRQVTNAK